MAEIRLPPYAMETVAAMRAAGAYPVAEDGLSGAMESLWVGCHNVCAKGNQMIHPDAILAPRGVTGSARVDYIFVHEGNYVGVCEIKKFWAVTDAQIQEVFNSMFPPLIHGLTKKMKLL
jgi:hypothetical protein